MVHRMASVVASYHHIQQTWLVIHKKWTKSETHHSIHSEKWKMKIASLCCAPYALPRPSLSPLIVHQRLPASTLLTAPKSTDCLAPLIWKRMTGLARRKKVISIFAPAPAGAMTLVASSHRATLLYFWKVICRTYAIHNFHNFQWVARCREAGVCRVLWQMHRTLFFYYIFLFYVSLTLCSTLSFVRPEIGSRKLIWLMNDDDAYLMIIALNEALAHKRQRRKGAKGKKMENIASERAFAPRRDHVKINWISK